MHQKFIPVGEMMSLLNKKKDIETEFERAKKAKEQLEAEENAIELEKSRKVANRQRLEKEYQMRCQVFGVNKPAYIRLFLYLQACSRNPLMIVNAKAVESYRLTKLFAKLESIADEPEQPPRFDKDNNLIA